MSGLVKTWKKKFKKIKHITKKYWKYVVMAIAIYFTAGLALSMFPATAGFAASLPGFAAGGFAGLGVGAGSVAGAGVFSQVATGMGMGAGLAGGAAAVSGGAAVATGAAAAGTAGAGVAGAGAAGAAAGIETVTVIGSAGAGVGAAGTAAAVGAGVAGAAASGGSAAPAAKTGMTFADKLQMAAVGTSAVSQLIGPSEKDLINEQAKFHGSYYGMDEKGGGSATAVPPGAATIQKRAPAVPTAPTTPIPTKPKPTEAEQQAAAAQPFPTQPQPRNLIPEQAETPEANRLPQLQTQTNSARDLFSAEMEGVRYVS